MDQLKVESEGKPRKKEDRSVSLIELPTSKRAKRIDYLRENKPKLMTAKKTIGVDWKKVVGDSSFSPR